MDSQRNILLIALLFVSFLLYQQWNVETSPQPQGQGVTQQAQTSGDVPVGSDAVQPVADAAVSEDLITIESDVLKLTVDTEGGDVVRAELRQYDDELNSEKKFVLLKSEPGHTFTAQSGLIGANGIDTKQSRAQFNVSAKEFVLDNGQDELRVPMTMVKDGITYTKTYVLKRGNYAIDVSYTVDNQSAETASVRMYAQLKQTLMDDGGSLTMPTYRGGVYSADNQKYEKYSFDDMQDKNLNLTISVNPSTKEEGWAAMMQHYFVSAWVPREEGDTNLFTSTSNGLGFIGVLMPPVQIAPGTEDTLKATLWVGPKLQDEMKATATNLELTVDYGWLWFIASPLHSLLTFIQSLVSNWGVSIILMTMVIRGLMYPLTKAQYTSMAKMRMLQPKLQEMRERIGDDRQRMSQEMMELYKKEKVNPLGGCLPLILQMPIFIAFYWSLMESVELRHAPFMLWIQDLSAQDPYYVLPILMGASMFLIQKMSPSTITDPMQQKIMNFMPIMFTVFFLWFPSGLVLYWLVSNIMTLIQQFLIYRSLEKKGLHSRA